MFMKEYLGETILDIHKTKYAMYTQQDWVMMWIFHLHDAMLKNVFTFKKCLSFTIPYIIHS